MPPTLLLSCDAIGKGFGARPLFENLSFGISEGDRVGLIGPNGSGKSTLLKILAGIEEPDSGIRSLRRGVRMGYVPQDPAFPTGRTVEEVVAEALADDPAEDFEKLSRVTITLGRAGFNDPAQAVDILSGGWRKRLAIARELVREPDVLLLDEPTNHLDVEAILWLESLLRSEPEAFIVVSHDRYFLDNVAKRMLELNRVYPDGLFQSDGSYTDFLEKRDELLRNEAAYQETLANLVRREVEWLRRGPKARTTKAKSRIQSAGKLMGELEESRSRTREQSAAKIDFTASDRKTKRLWSAKGLRRRVVIPSVVEGSGAREAARESRLPPPRSLDDARDDAGGELFRDLDILLTPGTRLGVLGPNGSGKTTLLRTIIGELPPDAGTIERAEQLRIVYFEQNRQSLDPNVTLKRALATEGDSVIYRDR